MGPVKPYFVLLINYYSTPEFREGRGLEIKLRNADELNRLLDVLALEIVDANIYYQLYNDLINSIKDHAREFSQSNTFWFFSFNALFDAVMIRLCRIYDQESTSLNLFNLLETIKANFCFFDKEHFRERVKDNPFVESLAEDNRIPDKCRLEEDISWVKAQNPLIKKLMIHRNNIVAPRGAKVSLGKDEILADNPLTLDEIKLLLDRCFEIFNRYLHLYRASVWSRKVPGHDDYKYILKFIKLGLQKWDEDIEKELQELKRKRAEQDEG